MKLVIYDLQSGLRDIEWEIRDAEGESVVYGGGRVPVHVHVSAMSCVNVKVATDS